MFWGKREKKENAEGYHRTESKPKNDLKRFYPVGFGLMILGGLLIAGAIFYPPNKNNKKEQTAGSCGELATLDNKTESLAPFRPVVQSKLNFSYKLNEKICNWKFNGVNAGATAPYNGYCVRSGLAYYQVGKTTVGLSINGKNCNRSLGLTVTGLSEAQQQENQKIKNAVPPAGAIKESLN